MFPVFRMARPLHAVMAGWLAMVLAVCDAEATPQIDAVLLVDTSASMLETDPANHRLEAVRLFVSLLDGGDRVALVGFDAKATVFSGFVEASEGNKQQLFDLIGRQVLPQGSYTNLRDAVAAALELAALHRQGNAPLVILLTDGKMDTGQAELDHRLNNELRGPLLSRMIDQDIRLYGLAFSSKSDVDFLQSLARPSGGFARTVTDPRDLIVVFSEIFQAVKQPDRLPVQDGHLTVDAGVKELRMVNRSADGAELTLRSPSGARLQGGEGGSDGLIRVNRPEPGDWTVEGGDGASLVFIDTEVSVALSLPPTLQEGDPTATAEAWLSHDGARLDPAAAGGSLTAAAWLKSLAPGSGNERRELAPVPLADGGFRLPLPALSAGVYELEVVLSGSGFRRAKNVSLNVQKPLAAALNAAAPAAASAVAPPAAALEAANRDASDALAFDEAEFADALSALLWGNLLILLTAGLVFIVVQMRSRNTSDGP